MKTFILIHGSWHNAWNWHRVVPLLNALGHKVFALDLPGMGRDKTPIQSVKMIETVQKLVEFINPLPGKVILVGHSKNGIMISQLAECIPNKIERLIYLAAYLIPDGKTQKEYSQQDIHGWLKPFVEFHPESQSTTLNPEIYREGLYHDCDPSISQMAKWILSHEPIESGSFCLKLTERSFGSLPRYYIECTEDRAVTPFMQQKMYLEMGVNEVYKLPSSHSPFFSMPESLVSIFQEIALLEL